MIHSFQITTNFYWVGVFDFDLRTFDIVMQTPYGTTYNSYLLKTQVGNVLFETVKKEFTEESIQRIHEILEEDETIDYIILNHTEPDHSGSLVELLNEFPNATIIGTPAALNNIKYIGHISSETKTINSVQQQRMDFGNYHIKFLIQPFLHWPDTMMTVIEELKILVPCDFLGCHYAESKLIDSQVTGKDELMKTMYKHYFDCVMKPFKPHVLKGIHLIENNMGFSVDDLTFVCCSHGPILQKRIKEVIEWYKEWAQPTILKNKIVIVYGSAYGYTKQMAEEIKKGIKSVGYEVHLYDISQTSIPDILDDFEDSKGMLLGSPTIVGDAIPHFYQLLSHLNPIIHHERFIQCFGSYGWSGEGVKNLVERIKQLKVKEINKPLCCRFQPSLEMKQQCFEWGKDFIEKIEK
jgi:flavorubredoxin